MIYLAPLQGLTDSIFRRVFPKYFGGVDSSISPFIKNSDRIKLGKRVFSEFTPEKNTGLPVVPQILSRDPDDFLAVSSILKDMGFNQVNWNLGCPSPVVTGKGKGAAMLAHPSDIEKFLEKVMPEIGIKLSVKLRIGYQNPDEIFSIIPILNSFPLEELIIHPRTGRQMYTGNVDLENFTRCLTLTDHRIVYNGDIKSVDDYRRLNKKFGTIGTWMLGRGLLSDPFLAEKIAGRNKKTESEKIDLIRNFHDELLEEYSKTLSGPAHLADRLKGHWFYLVNSFENSDKLRKKIRKTTNIKQYNETVRYIFSEEPLTIDDTGAKQQNQPLLSG